MNYKKIFKNLTKIALILIFLLGILLVGLYYAVKSPKVQTWLAQQITESLSEKLGLPIEIAKVEIDFFNTIHLEDLYIEDLNKDTLAYIHQLDANFSYFSLFQKKINLQKLNIDQVYINIYRNSNDTLFNIDAVKLENFANNTNQPSSIAAWDFVVQEVQLANTRVNFKDYYAGQVLEASLPQLALFFSYFNIGDTDFDLDATNIVQPFISYKILAPNPNYVKKDSTSFSLNFPIKLTSQLLSIHSGSFIFSNESDSIIASPYFNMNNMSFSSLNLESEKFSLLNDSIYSKITHLNFKEKSGFVLKEMQQEISISNQAIIIKDLFVETNQSKLEADIDFAFKSFDDFKNFGEDVKFNIDLKSSLFFVDDIQYFADISKFSSIYPYKVKGQIYGRVNSVKSKGLQVETAKSTLFVGDFSMNGLPEIKETFISANVDKFYTDYYDILRIYPGLALPEDLIKLGKVKFSGNFDGFINDFVTQGSLITELGSAETDLNFKLDENNNAFYSGSFSLQDFDLGKYFNLQESLGKVSLNGSGKGKGLKLNTLDIELEGTIEKIQFKNYTYQNILIDGRVRDKFFAGNLSINDENIALNFDGTIDATSTIPVYKFNADIQRFNPNALKLWKSNLTLSAQVNADFSASNLNNILGNLTVNDLILNNEENTYNIGNLEINSYQLKNQEKRIQLTSNDIDATVEGNFEFAKLPNAFKSVLVPNHREKELDQLLKFEINVKNNPQLVSFFVPELKILKPSIIEGNLNSNTQSMLAILKIPVVQYKDFSIVDWGANLYINQGNFELMNTIPLIYMKDSVLVKDFSILVNGPRNDLIVKLFADGSANSSVELFAGVITKNRRVKIEFKPSNIFINNQFWLIDDNNEIQISGDKISSNNLKLYNGISEIVVDLDIGASEQKADLYLSNIFIQDFTKFLSAKNIELKGVANGKVSMNVLDKTPNFYGDLLLENIEVNHYKVGNLNASATLDLPNKKVLVNANLYGDDNEVDINGSYSFSKTITPRDFDINIDIKNFAIYSIEEFIAQYIDNTTGTVSGKLQLVGPRNKPDLLGYVDVNDVTTTVTFLQTTYNIKNQRVNFEKNAINLGNNLMITDIEGNQAFGKGKIYHQNLKNIGIQIDAWTDKIMGLNTTLEDNQDFYGRAYLKGSVSFKGLTNDISISIKGESEGKTEIAIPLSESGTSSNYQFYSFIEKVKDEEKDFLISSVEKLKVNSLTVNLDLDIDNDCKVKIILDQSTGDVLEVKGEGNVKIFVPKDGDVLFYGSYLINDGDYLFTLQNIINKKFRIEPNSYLNFQGKIEDTQVNVDAVYNLRAAPENLIKDFLASNTDEQIEAEVKNRVPVKLLLSLKNNLFNPDIFFDIQIDQLNPQLRNLVDRKIFTLKQYENEMNRQVFGLLVLNQFLPPLSSIDQVTSGGFNVNASDAANTVSEFLSNQLTRYFNDWLSYLSDDVSLNFNYRNYEQDGNTSIEDLTLRRELQLALTTKFLNDRVTINVGGNVDFGANQLGSNNSNTTYFGGNASIEYALTENRRFRIKAFTNTDYDYFNQGNNTRAGIGLSFKREFDLLKELKISKNEFKIKAPKIDTSKTTPQN